MLNKRQSFNWHSPSFYSM